MKNYTSIQEAYIPSCFAKAISGGFWKGQLPLYYHSFLEEAALDADEMKNDALSPLFLWHVAQTTHTAATLVNGADAAAKKKWQNPDNIGAALQVKVYAQGAAEPFTGVYFFAAQAVKSSVPYYQTKGASSLFACWYESEPGTLSQIPPRLAGSSVTRIELAGSNDVKKLAAKKELLQKFLDQ